MASCDVCMDTFMALRSHPRCAKCSANLCKSCWQRCLLQRTTCPVCRSDFVAADRVLRYMPPSVVLEHAKVELRARARQELEDALLARSLGGSE